MTSRNSRGDAPRETLRGSTPREAWGHGSEVPNEMKAENDICTFGSNCKFLNKKNDIPEEDRMAHFRVFTKHYSRRLCKDGVKCARIEGDPEHSNRCAHSKKELDSASLCKFGASCKNYWNNACPYQHNLTPKSVARPAHPAQPVQHGPPVSVLQPIQMQPIPQIPQMEPMQLMSLLQQILNQQQLMLQQQEAQQKQLNVLQHWMENSQ